MPILAEQIARGAEEAGAQVETVYLHGLKIAPCQSCYACQKKNSKGCAIDDDMQPLYGKLIESDCWVIASPVFWFTMSAQVKLFLDRCFAMPAYGKNPFAGKRVAIAMTYGDVDPFVSGCVNALRTFQDAIRFLSAEITGMVYGSAWKAGEIKKNKTLLKKAYQLGKDLAVAI